MELITIYGLFDPLTDDLRYVGKAKDAQKRLREYCHPALGSMGSALWIWLRTLRARSEQPVMKILELISEDDWPACESFWIAKCRIAGMPLLNVMPGGGATRQGVAQALWLQRDGPRQELWLKNTRAAAERRKKERIVLKRAKIPCVMLSNG